MSQSNRHWPSMFRSKPCGSPHQWQHDHSSKSPYGTGEDKSPDPKPRWNPRPEQIRILEGIFNSGMVNPPRDEIRKIRCQLQEYGQVGDANVFYWFQNRKSRSKSKSRARSTPRATPPAKTLAAAPKRSSPSSTSEKSSSNAQKKPTLGLSALSEMNHLPTTSVTQTVFTPTTGDFLQEPFALPVQQGTSAMTQGLYFSDFTSLFQMHDQAAAGNLGYTGFFQELMVDQDDINKEDEEKMRMNCYSFVNTPTHVNSGGTAIVSDSTVTATAPGNLHAMAPPAGLRVMQVYIDDEMYEVGQGLLNIREAFGANKILFHISGQHVPTDEWGVTLQPLQHGSSYYLFSPGA